MPLEAWLGLSGSLLLLVGPARDQFNRLRITAQTALGREAGYQGRRAMARLRGAVAQGYAARGAAWNWLDSLTMGIGARLLAASYIWPHFG